ncbi:hypothetical protein [uncultured Mediterranean phage uvMED]|nr:hypothetical protein [uncultured Mediterranean phage uvMED]
MTKEEITINKGYRIDKKGNVFNKKNIKLKGWLDKDGYKILSVRYMGKVLKVPFHRLQAYKKHGKDLFNEGMETRHLNGIKKDNSYDNITIGTHSQNMMDIPCDIRLKNALYATSHVRKYDKKEVFEFHNQSKSYKKTMSKFNIGSKGTLNYILKSYKDE